MQEENRSICCLAIYSFSSMHFHLPGMKTYFSITVIISQNLNIPKIPDSCNNRQIFNAKLSLFLAWDKNVEIIQTIFLSVNYDLQQQPQLHYIATYNLIRWVRVKSKRARERKKFSVIAAFNREASYNWSKVIVCKSREDDSLAFCQVWLRHSLHSFFTLTSGMKMKSNESRMLA